MENTDRVIHRDRQCFNVLAMRCPYCSLETGIDELRTSSESHVCPECSRPFRLLYTDYNSHSPSEISEALPYMNNRMGAITAFLVREDQRFCTVCGSFYTREDRICPGLLYELKSWYKDPEPVCKSGVNLTPHRVRYEIESFLKKKVKRAVLESIVGKKLT